MVDGEVRFYTSYIEGLPALDTMPEPLFDVYVSTYKAECDKAQKAQSGVTNDTTSEEKLEKLFKKKGII